MEDSIDFEGWAAKGLHESPVQFANRRRYEGGGPGDRVKDIRVAWLAARVCCGARQQGRFYYGANTRRHEEHPCP
jgi:hypothetical protein